MFKLFLLALFSLSLQAELLNGVAILVKNHPITLYEVKQALNKSDLGLDKTVDELIRKKLEEIEIQERKIVVNDSEIFAEIEKMAEQNKMSVMQLYDAMQEVRHLSEKEFKAKLKEKKLKEKLFNSIAFEHLKQPSLEEEQEYYKLHADQFKHPESFKVVVYQSNSKELLQHKIDNPMYYSPKISHQEQVLPYNKINPRLAELLNRTPLNSFTPIVPAQNNGHMSFYMQEKTNVSTQSIDAVRPQIANAIMGEKRNQILNDYFARARLSADIHIMRLPE